MQALAINLCIQHAGIHRSLGTSHQHFFTAVLEQKLHLLSASCAALLSLSHPAFHLPCCRHHMQTVIIATGAVARRLEFAGSDEVKGFWNKGISACAVCDGAAPIFRK